MKKYKLTEIKGYITEDEGIFVLHDANGSQQSCTKNEIDFYGGVLVVQDLNSEIELKPFTEEIVVEEPVKEEKPKPVKKKATKKVATKKRSIISKIFNK